MGSRPVHAPGALTTVGPVSRRAHIARLRRLAIARGNFTVRTWERPFLPGRGADPLNC